jgi:DNA invertase Pin-like site-specific DNA recombinase
LDAKGRGQCTILSSLAQDESRSISENCTWGIRRRFETGKHKMSTKRFLGYDTDEEGKLVINQKQKPIVVRLYQEFLDGKTTDYIKRIFEKEGVENWDGGTKWQATTLMSMLENKKVQGGCPAAEKLYGGFPYQEADTEQGGNPDVLCGR